MSCTLGNLEIPNDLQVLTRPSVTLFRDELTDDLLKLHGLLLIAIQFEKVDQRRLCLPTVRAPQMSASKGQQAEARSYLAWLHPFGFQRGITAAGGKMRLRKAILAMNSNTDGLINESQEEHGESRQSLGIEKYLDLGNQFIERATLIGNAIGNFEGKGILQGLGSMVNVSK